MRIGEGGHPGIDVCKTGSGGDEADESEQNAVVAAGVSTAHEQAHGVAHEDDRQGERNTTRGAFDDSTHCAADGSGDVPPFECGDDEG